MPADVCEGAYPMMERGMLWFDDTPGRAMSAKIEAAVTHYRRKYGRSPNVCYVHSGCLQSQSSQPAGIRVLGLADMLPDHFWVGVHKRSEGDSSPSDGKSAPESLSA